jgi:hypothetical protein
MTARVWPADAVGGAPLYSGRALRQLLGSLITGGTAARPLGGRTGVTPGTPSNTVTATTSTWSVKTHSGCMDVEASVIAGTYIYAFDTAVSGSMNAADATNPRIDLISVQLSDPAESDGSSTPGVSVVYTAGTAAASPAVPAAPARSLVLARLTVPAAGGGSPAVSWVAPYTVASGGVIPVSGTSQYPASPYVGQYIDDAALGLLRWNGTAWTPGVIAKMLTRSSGSSSIASGTEVTVAGWDGSPYDKGGIGYSAGVFTVPVPGLYTWSMTLGLLGMTPAYIQHVSVTVNGVANLSGEVQYNVPANSNAQYISAGGPLLLAANDQVALRFQQNSGVTMAVTQVSASLIRVGS